MNPDLVRWLVYPEDQDVPLVLEPLRHRPECHTCWRLVAAWDTVRAEREGRLWADSAVVAKDVRCVRSASRRRWRSGPSGIVGGTTEVERHEIRWEEWRRGARPERLHGREGRRCR